MKRLAKIGITNLFEAMLFAPKSYTDTRLITRLESGARGSLRVKIINQKRLPNGMLKMDAQMLDFGANLALTIFHAKPYHTQVFALGKELFVLGTLGEFGGAWQMTQPKVTTQIGTVVMNFAPTRMQNANLNAILREVITREAMLEVGLDSRSAEHIWVIFHPEATLEKSGENAANLAGDSRNLEDFAGKNSDSADTKKIIAFSSSNTSCFFRKENLYPPHSLDQKKAPLSFSTRESLAFSASSKNRDFCTAAKDSRDFCTTKRREKDEIFNSSTTPTTDKVRLSPRLNQMDFATQPPSPHANFLCDFAQNGGFFGGYLEALKFVEIFYHMRFLRSKKRVFEALSPLNGDVGGFLETLPFRLTKGQDNAIRFLREKLGGKTAARCVVMGDVGCGKTMVIFACVMMAYPKKSVLLAPTSILARQLYDEARRFLPPKIKVALLLSGDKLEPCDFLIGTTALLWRDLRDFSLLMTDEQHRFGTAQRQRLEIMLTSEGKKPHNVQFSATPIPRTMALIESNLVDFCHIYDLPFEKNITTKIITKPDFAGLLAHIRAAIARKEQVAIIYPLVEKSEALDYQSLEEALNFWQKNFAKVHFTHGKDRQKEEIIEDFRGQGELLLATTLFEVGISLPRLSTIVIVGAERLGFATLHQLRGRVSRNGLRGYCFLFTKAKNPARLEDFVRTTSGFEIAELDLKYRSSGDLQKGLRQSGEQFRFFNMADDREIALRAARRLDEIDGANKVI